MPNKRGMGAEELGVEELHPCNILFVCVCLCVYVCVCLCVCVCVHEGVVCTVAMCTIVLNPSMNVHA